VHKVTVNVDVSKIPADLNLGEIAFSAEYFANKDLNAPTTTTPASCLLKNDIRTHLLH